MFCDRKPEEEMRHEECLREKFSQAYTAHGSEILKYLLASGLQTADAQDVLQISFLAMWELRFRIEDPGNLAPLWFTIARHRMFDFFRRSRRMFSLTSELDHLPDPGNSVHELDQEYLRKRIAEALRLLPEEMAEAYRMTKISGFSIRETAEILGLSESDIKSKVFRARKKLMETLADLKEFHEN